MLGEHLGTISGPTTMKALPAVGGAPTFETTVSGIPGTLAGAEVVSLRPIRRRCGPMGRSTESAPTPV
ncbi:MAG: hypothetical protein CM1200mP26_15420 [Acidimicrobiales bacterium]|nr:MAG: hypothetical protein CM1200mP26_15420 [Acidimicrobiales bacterium]